MAEHATVAIVGAKDQQIETLLRAAGLRTTNIRAEDLVELAHPSSSPPNVLVLDLRARQTLPDGLAQLKRHHADTAAIIVTDVLDANLMLEAMRGGVSEYVTDLTGDDLVAAVSRLAAQRVAQEAGDVLVFLGAKGGVGTTTAAVNVATALAKVGTTLMIDLHLAGGDAALFFGVEPRFTVSDALENTQRLDSAFFRSLVTRTKVGVDLLAASERPHAGPAEPARIRSIVDFAARHYRYTVVDVSRYEPATLDSLEVATAIVLVATQELPAVRSAARLAGMLRGRYGKEKITVLLGRSDRNAEIAQEDVARAVGVSAVTALPSDHKAALEAMNRGRPVAADVQGPLPEAFHAYARRLARVSAEDQTLEGRKAATQRSGILGRLSGRR